MNNKLRLQVLTRDNNTCQRCFNSPSLLHIHHIIPVVRQGSDNLINLITLCPSCHKTIEPKDTLNMKQKTMTLLVSQIKNIQTLADQQYEGDFSRAIRIIISKWEKLK